VTGATSFAPVDDVLADGIDASRVRVEHMDDTAARALLRYGKSPDGTGIDYGRFNSGPWLAPKVWIP
jgi:hypothetical protein